MLICYFGIGLFRSKYLEKIQKMPNENTKMVMGRMCLVSLEWDGKLEPL